MKNCIWFILVSIIGFVTYINPVSAISITTSTSTGQVVTLSPGWNTFSTPKVLDNLTFQSGGTGLFFYSLSSTWWSIVNPNITTIKPLEWYIVNNSNSGTRDISLSYKTNLSPLEMIFQKSLHSGWNIVGITSNSNPFTSINSNVWMGLDFTKTSDGITNYNNKVANTFYTTTGNANLNSFLLGESYGLFLQSPLLLPGIQPQAWTDGEIWDFIFSKYSTWNTTFAYGSSGITLFNWLISSTLPITIKQFIVTPINTGSGIDSFVDDKLIIKINGSEVWTISNLTNPQTYNVSSTTINETWSITIEWSIKNDPSIYSENRFDIAITWINDSRNASINIGTWVSILGDKVDIKTPSAELKTATIAPPSNSKIYGNASGLEIGGFSIKANVEELTVREITLTNIAGSGVDDFTKLVSGTNVKLVNIADNTQVSATINVSTGSIRLTGMSFKVPKDVTSNFKVLIDTQGDIINTFAGANNKLMLNIAIDSASFLSVISPSIESINTTKIYTISLIPPTVTLVKQWANRFTIRVTNVDPDNNIILNSITARVNSVSMVNLWYTAFACIRDEGSTDNCDLFAVENKIQAIPGSGITFSISSDSTGNTFPVSIQKNTYIGRELFINSNYVSPSDLQAEVTSLNYSNSGGNMSFDEVYSVIAQ